MSGQASSDINRQFRQPWCQPDLAGDEEIRDVIARLMISLVSECAQLCAVADFPQTNRFVMAAINRWASAATEWI
jgi:hypothetical protein